MFDERDLNVNDYMSQDYAVKWENTERSSNPKNHLDKLSMSKNEHLLDVGCGTGFHVIPASKMCKKVIGLDISKKMLHILSEKASKREINNIELVNEGMLNLSISHKVDKVISWGTIHHVPDIWKPRVFQNIYESMKPGGRFLLMDILIERVTQDIESKVEKWTNNVNDGKDTSEDIKNTFKTEYPTYLDFIVPVVSEIGFDVIHMESRCWGCWHNILMSK